MMKTRQFVIMLFFLLFSLCSADEPVQKGEKATELFDNLMVGQERDKEAKKDWVTETLEQIYQAKDQQNWEEVIRLSDKILSWDAGHREAKKEFAEAKRKLFWKHYGDHFIVIIVFLMILPWLTKFVNELISYKPKKENLLSEGRDLFVNKKYQKTIDFYKKIIESPKLSSDLQMKDLAEIHYQIGNSYYSLNKIPQAVKSLSESLKFDNTNEAVHTVLTRSFLKQGADHERAIQEYQQYFRKNTQDMDVIELLAKHYLKKEATTDDALAVYRKYIKVEPDNKDLIRLIVLRFIRKHESSKEALDLYERFLTYYPDKNEVRRELAKIYFVYEDFQKCVDICRHLIDLGKDFIDDSDLHKLNVEAHQKLGKYEELKQYYEEAKAKHSKNQKFVELAGKIIGTGEESQFAEKIISKPAEEDSNFYICPNCAHLNPRDSEYCLGCGKLLQG